MLTRYRPLIPALILAAFCISTLIFWLKGTTTDEGAPADYVLTAKHYGAFAATGATLASFFLLRHYFKYLFGLTFLLGILGLINFTISEMNVGLAVGPLQIGLSPVLALTGIVAYLLYSQRINAKLLSLTKPSEEKVARAQQDEIALFKDRFAQKSTEELTQIVNTNSLVAPAVIAAQQLLKERQ